LTLALNERNNRGMEIKRLRRSSGLTQKEFSTRYQIPLKTLQNWETDTSSPSARTCPTYVVSLLRRAVMEDFTVARNLLEADVDMPHLIAIEQAKDKIIKSPLSGYVKDVVLYGSTARGKAKPTSDVDILLVLDERIKKNSRYNDWITYLKGNISSDDYTIPEADLHVVFDEKWRDNKDAYFSNIKKEGFSIWS